MRLAFSCCCFARADLDASLGDGGEHNGAVLPLRDLVAPCAPSPPRHPHLSPVPSTSAVLLSPGCSYCMRSAGCWLHSASAALRHCGFQPHCRLSACSARWRGSRYRLRCAHQRRRSACRALTAQRGRVPGGLASPRASWSMRSRSGQASRRRRPSWCSVQVQPACTARVACTHATEPAELVRTWPVFHRARLRSTRPVLPHASAEGRAPPCTAALDVIVETVANGDKVTLVNFGTFDSKRREAREGRNPQTNKPMHIPGTCCPGGPVLGCRRRGTATHACAHRSQLRRRRRSSSARCSRR